MVGSKNCNDHRDHRCDVVEIAVLQAVKFGFVIDGETAKTLGLVAPPALLSRTDEMVA